MLCPNCASELDGDRCDNCGFTLKIPAGGVVPKMEDFAPPVRPPPGPGMGFADYPAQGFISRRDDTPMSIGGFIGMILIAMVPIAGFALLIFWTCSKKVNVNRRNWAAAMLIILAVIFVFTLGAAIVWIMNFGPINFSFR